MTTFYCVRHGKTEFNQQHIFQGGLADSPLLPEGQKTAALAGEYLSDVTFDRAFVSPQKRAQDTAEILLANHTGELTEFMTIENLREMEFGEWDGLPEANFEHLLEFQNLVHRPHLYNPTAFKGEDFETLITRLKEVFTTLAKDYPNDTILIVSHGLALQAILKHFDNIPLADLRSGDFLGNTSISVVQVDPTTGEFDLTLWNDTTHTS